MNFSSNMMAIPDIFIVFPFIALVMMLPRWAYMLSTGIAIVTAEVFFTLPFGTYILAFWLSLSILRFMLKNIELYADMNIVFVFLLSIFTYVAWITAIQWVLVFRLNYDVFTRGALLYAHLVVVGMFVAATIWCVRYSLSWIRYAFVEERV